jgi:hypothetical protein
MLQVASFVADNIAASPDVDERDFQQIAEFDFFQRDALSQNSHGCSLMIDRASVGIGSTS